MTRFFEGLAKLDDFHGESEMVSKWIRTLADALVNMTVTLRNMILDVSDDAFHAGLQDMIEDRQEIVGVKQSLKDL